MKTKKLLFICLLLSFMFTESFAQQITPLTAKMEIRLNPEALQQTEHIFGIKNLKFKTELQASQYFGAISDNLTTYELNFDAKTVTLILQVKNLSQTWNIKDWNDYFVKKQRRYVAYYEGI